MAMGTTQTQNVSSTSGPANYTRPLIVVTSLFFMWGFLTCLNDILVPHLKSIFDLSYAQVMLVQFAFFSAYFVFSIPASKIVDAIGYKGTMVAGLLTMGVGAFLFVPAAAAPSFPLFLTALIILAAGITALQVAANPYVIVLGKPETASSRLNLTQAFNSLGTTIAPWIGGFFILSSAPLAMEELRKLAPDALQAYRVHEASSVKMPYVVIGVALVLLAVIIAISRLPQIAAAQHPLGEKVNDSIWKHRNLVLGAVGIFTYVGAEVSIGSFLVNYFSQPYIAGITEKEAARFVSLYWGGAMVGRFIGAALLRKVSTSRLLALNAFVAALLVTISMLTTGSVAMYSIILVGFFNSIMFPSIFTLGVAELGPLTGDGSGLLNMAIVGGAIIPVIQGYFADKMGIHHAFFLPVVCYLFIVYYALFGSKPRSERLAAAKA
jgi:FHS family L-fucose permease-like MFS transporter